MSFNYKGRVIRTHNRLLGKFEGTDGIKTGYIRASGFNLTSSVKRGDKRIIGVVMGGKTGNARNSYMISMLSKHLPKCKDGKMLAASIRAHRRRRTSNLQPSRTRKPWSSTRSSSPRSRPPRRRAEETAKPASRQGPALRQDCRRTVRAAVEEGDNAEDAEEDTGRRDSSSKPTTGR